MYDFSFSLPPRQRCDKEADYQQHKSASWWPPQNCPALRLPGPVGHAQLFGRGHERLQGGSVEPFPRQLSWQPAAALHRAVLCGQHVAPQPRLGLWKKGAGEGNLQDAFSQGSGNYRVSWRPKGRIEALSKALVHDKCNLGEKDYCLKCVDTVSLSLHHLKFAKTPEFLTDAEHQLIDQLLCNSYVVAICAEGAKNKNLKTNFNRLLLA